jgi:hypothetical protein
MARRIHGLVGPGIGPRLRVGEATRLHTEINGMKTGKVYAKITTGNSVELRIFEENGCHEIPLGDTVSFEYDGKCMTICSLRVD